MSDWKTLTSIALLGTDRAATEFPLPEAVVALLPATTPAEARVLRVAGILGLLQATTYGSAPEAVLPAPAAEETSVAVSRPDFSALLQTILGEGNLTLIREACALLAGKGALLPPVLIPVALEHARRHKTLREPVQNVIGKRGAWLASQNEAWKFSAAADAEDTDPKLWDTGTPLQRQSYLAYLHRAQPAEAIALMRTAFPSESAANRVSFLEAINSSVTAEDASFLTDLLAHDRSKEVRAQVAAALSALPESEFAQRMSARLAQCIFMERKLLAKRLKIEPPTEFTADMAKDTLEQKPPHQVGERAWWLQQMVALTPLTWWEKHLGLDPAEVLSHVNKNEWLKPVLAGLQTAVNRQPKAEDWAVALLDTGWLQTHEYITLALRLAGERQQRAFVRLLEAAKDSDTLYTLIATVDLQFSAPLWDVIHRRLPDWLKGQDWRFRDTLKGMATRIPASALNQDIALPDASLFSEAIAEFLRLIDQRRALHRFIATPYEPRCPSPTC